MGRKTQRRFKCNYDEIELNHTQIAVKMVVSEVTIRQWMKFGVPGNRMREFCNKTGMPLPDGFGDG